MMSDNLTGQMLGQYELRELLGIGGMGSVYRGFQTALKREVAVKVLPATLAQQPGYIERFTREAETAAALEHPHIVPIVDYGTQRGISYVVMRLLTGGTLADRINHSQVEGRGLPSLGETAKLLRELASAVDYAHNRGVIHRDIKTSNVMFDNQGNAYLVDFGIAKLMHATNKLTGTGVSVGTPAYMAPEQWSGEEVFPATDQYSLAVLAYITITGREPFEASTPFQLLNKHLHEMPTPLTVVRADLPPALDIVLARALAKDPKARFPSCTAFAQAFESAIEGNKGAETNFFVFKVPPRKQSSPAFIQPSPPYTPTGMTSAPPPKRNNGLLIGMGAFILVLIGLSIALIASGGDKNETTAPTHTPVPVVVILPSDEPIITPPNVTATWEAMMTMTHIANAMLASQSATAEIISTQVPPTQTPLPSSTPITPTIVPTRTPLPSFTPIPPTDISFITPQVRANRLGVWIYDNPRVEGASVNRLGFIINDTADVVGISPDGGWLQVQYKGQVGWMSRNSSNITILGDVDGVQVVAQATATPQPVMITANRLGVWIYDNPRTEGASVNRLGFIINDTADVVGISPDGGWLQVQYKGQVGWVSRDSGNITISGDANSLVVITP